MGRLFSWLNRHIAMYKGCDSYITLEESGGHPSKGPSRNVRFFLSVFFSSTSIMCCLVQNTSGRDFHGEPTIRWMVSFKQKPNAYASMVEKMRLFFARRLVHIFTLFFLMFYRGCFTADLGRNTIGRCCWHWIHSTLVCVLPVHMLFTVKNPQAAWRLGTDDGLASTY